MREKQVTITIRTEQCQEEGRLRWETVVPGVLTEEEDRWVLRYREAETSGLGGAETTLTLAAAEAVMERAAPAPARMEFVPGRSRPARYCTGAGELDLAVEAETLQHKITGQGGMAMIRYRLTSGGAHVGSYTLKLNIKERKE